MSTEKGSAMRHLKWLGSLGGLCLFVGLLVTTTNQGAGIIIAAVGIIILLGVGYIAYDFGRR